MAHYMYVRLDYEASPGHGPSVHGIVKVRVADWESDSEWIEVKGPINCLGVYHRKFFTGGE